MKTSEKLFLNELAQEGFELQRLLKNLSIGEIVVMIRKQLRMSQRTLAKRAKVPQPTISKLERSQNQPNVSTIKKIFDALFCDILIVPILQKSIDEILINQARAKAEQQVRYLQGSMKLEEQEPDQRLINELIKQETEEWLKSSKLWE